MRKAFVGPIGDDLPSVIIIILSLIMFFTAITYSFNAYNQKLDSLRLLRAGLETGRMLASKGVLSYDINHYDSAAQDIAATYGVSIKVTENENDCNNFPYKLKYLVTVMSGSINDVELKTAWVCVKR